MTLWASREGDQITIHGNIHLDVQVRNGQVAEWSVTEDAAHVRSFWGQLGTLVNEAEQAAEGVLIAGGEGGELPPDWEMKAADASGPVAEEI